MLPNKNTYEYKKRKNKNENIFCSSMSRSHNMKKHLIIFKTNYLYRLNNCTFIFWQLECLAVNYCSKVSGSTLKTLFQRSKRLKCLLMNQTGMLITVHNN